ncbi:hypothetical protein MLD38_017907 [Melastoma candidum]|uniref:Uncharacterized protein n=1 Tax=Melastoma candidum TaxID=119954 RepID=A0ACB9QSP8_9MYRT|nr:hypothetical protein MLD38_017907 [Melastoma candidum]
MEEDYGGGYCSSKRSGQIPAFGDWDYADDLPITQYFETARQAGLLNRYSSSSGECGGGGSDDMNSDRRGRNKGNNVAPTRRHARGSGDAARKTRPTTTTTTTDNHKQQRFPQVTGSDHFPKNKQSARRTTAAAPAMHPNGYYDDDKAVSAYPRPTTMPARATRVSAKPVDEDLYKIPPDLLRTTKRKKMLGFFSCLVPCAA